MCGVMGMHCYVTEGMNAMMLCSKMEKNAYEHDGKKCLMMEECLARGNKNKLMKLAKKTTNGSKGTRLLKRQKCLIWEKYLT